MMYPKLKSELDAQKVELIAVSKAKPVSDILDLYKMGQIHFGENKVQELVSKMEVLPKDICWHLIGHLQKNKVKYIAPFIYLIHSLDSLDLYKTIDKEAKKNNRKISVLLQFFIADEETKFGLDINEAIQIIKFHQSNESSNIIICGVMGMASYSENPVKISEEFKSLKAIFDRLKVEYFNNNQEFKEISMGMSGDYQIAIDEGSTMVRIGSLLFGNRTT